MNEVSLGAAYLGEGRCRFMVWAPLADRVDVHIVAPRELQQTLARGKRGYHHGVVEGVEPGSRYFYVLDGEKKRPDPASRYQPEGVHGPSQVVYNHDFNWTDACWCSTAQDDLILYELHVGTFTPEGTFAAVIPHLDELRELGVTAIEIMPVAQFPGSRNWGYDGVYPYAVQNSYGGPRGLQQLVDACHQKGLAVILDVVYNHLGPEGNYLPDFAPYFTDRYKGPWGALLNFDGPASDEVRRFFIENTLYWLTEFHMDGFRLDAVHAIKDFSAQPFLQELAAAVHRQGELLGRRVHVIAESDLNDARVILPPVMGGYGMDAQWADDFHHSLHTLLTGEQRGYYKDFGRLEHLARAFRAGYVYTGQYSRHRRRRHGNSPVLCPGNRFVVFAQNHDQVGNRAFGERLSTLTSFAGLKLAACAVFLSPFIPMLFMGEEYGETAPFQYFTSHTDPELAEAVRKGRREEFAAFDWEEEVPDPQDEATFRRSRLNHDLRRQGHHRVLYRLYRQLIRLRREVLALANLSKDDLEAIPCGGGRVLFIRRRSGDDEVCIAFSFSEKDTGVTLPVPAGRWHKLLDTAEERWLGGGGIAPASIKSAGEVQITLPPRTCVLFRREKEE
ncbi:malto-oligosyltrehalose trehalohydrolase [Desulfoscipio geothermicus]|uniref:Malto-oligosyltrehalose trehalohydrolase n=1 Tax=Desulfoscipio geothermicus DSM 3669 TaxID=1121426 RepID=A0A1I6DTN6_9FIRM|nr:malto-oligosyltrehalose trehalohydrolase [Desulfoscipio geothermicus]SFR08668.1 maltooligosyl trehalose hydrolase [Desulfoscipio geothermicus DSM 3669]